MKRTQGPEEITHCLRCSGVMQSLGIHKIQLGETGLFFPNLCNFMAGALKVELCVCDECGKVEFYSTKRKVVNGKLRS